GGLGVGTIDALLRTAPSTRIHSSSSSTDVHERTWESEWAVKLRAKCHSATLNRPAATKPADDHRHQRPPTPARPPRERISTNHPLWIETERNRWCVRRSCARASCCRRCWSAAACDVDPPAARPVCAQPSRHLTARQNDTRR